MKFEEINDGYKIALQLIVKDPNGKTEIVDIENSSILFKHFFKLIKDPDNSWNTITKILPVINSPEIKDLKDLNNESDFTI